MPSSKDVRPASLAPTNISATRASSNNVRNRALLTWPNCIEVGPSHRTLVDVSHDGGIVIVTRPPGTGARTPARRRRVVEASVCVRVADQHALAARDVVATVVHVLLEGPRRGADPGDHRLDPQHQAGPELGRPQIVDRDPGGDIAPVAGHSGQPGRRRCEQGHPRVLEERQVASVVDVTHDVGVGPTHLRLVHVRDGRAGDRHASGGFGRVSHASASGT